MAGGGQYRRDYFDRCVRQAAGEIEREGGEREGEEREERGERR